MHICSFCNRRSNKSIDDDGDDTGAPNRSPYRHSRSVEAVHHDVVTGPSQDGGRGRITWRRDPAKSEARKFLFPTQRRQRCRDATDWY